MAGEDLGLNDVAQACIDSAASCGVNLRFTAPLELVAAPSEYVERIDHIGIASVDNVTAEAVFVDQIGCKYESRQTNTQVPQTLESFTSDKYGVVNHSSESVLMGGLRVSFITIGDCELEFLQDYDPTKGIDINKGAPGDTKQDQSAIGRFVENRGPGLHHLALKCHDIDATLAHLANEGHRLIDHKGRPGSRAALIGFAHPSSLAGVLLHLVQREEKV